VSPRDKPTREKVLHEIRTRDQGGRKEDGVQGKISTAWIKTNQNIKVSIVHERPRQRLLPDVGSEPLEKEVSGPAASERGDQLVWSSRYQLLD
jgi:hypothetical protein